ncbi:unnamed protein product [Caretta caretta]
MNRMTENGDLKGKDGSGKKKLLIIKSYWRKEWKGNPEIHDQCCIIDSSTKKGMAEWDTVGCYYCSTKGMCPIVKNPDCFTPMICHCKVACTNNTLSLMFGCKKYRYQDEDALHDHTLPRLTHEVRGPELVHVSEKNLSQIENVHGYVLQSHISPLKVR